MVLWGWRRVSSPLLDWGGLCLVRTYAQSGRNCQRDTGSQISTKSRTYVKTYQRGLGKERRGFQRKEKQASGMPTRAAPQGKLCAEGDGRQEAEPRRPPRQRHARPEGCGAVSAAPLAPRMGPASLIHMVWRSCCPPAVTFSACWEAPLPPCKTGGSRTFWALTRSLVWGLQVSHSSHLSPQRTQGAGRGW